MASCWPGGSSGITFELMAEQLRPVHQHRQLRAGVDVQALVDQLGVLYHRVHIGDEPVTDEFLSALVGICPRALVRGLSIR